MNYPWPATDTEALAIFRKDFHPESLSELTRIYTTTREHGHSFHDAFRWTLEQLVIADTAVDHIRADWLEYGITDDQIDSFIGAAQYVGTRTDWQSVRRFDAGVLLLCSRVHGARVLRMAPILGYTGMGKRCVETIGELIWCSIRRMDDGCI